MERNQPEPVITTFFIRNGARLTWGAPRFSFILHKSKSLYATWVLYKKNVIILKTNYIILNCKKSKKSAAYCHSGSRPGMTVCRRLLKSNTTRYFLWNNSYTELTCYLATFMLPTEFFAETNKFFIQRFNVTMSHHGSTFWLPISYVVTLGEGHVHHFHVGVVNVVNVPTS